MSLRLRIGLAVGVVLVGFVVTLAVIIWAFSVKSVSEAEVREAEKDLVRAETYLQNTLSGMEAFVYDWSAWDDTFEFVETQVQAYIEENLGAYVFEAFEIDALVISDLGKSPVYAEAYDAEQEDATALNPDTLNALLEKSELFSSPDDSVTWAGYAQLSEGLAQVVSMPVSLEEEGEVNGTFLAVRYLDDAFMSQLEQNTATETSLSVGRADFTTDESSLSAITEAAVTLSASLPTLTGEPVQVVIEHPRSLYRQGIRGATALIILLFTLSLVFGVLTLVFVERLLLSRLTRLSHWVDDITRSGDLSQRLEVVGVDELAQLSTNINGMLETLQRSYQQLAESEERYSLVAEGVNDGLWDWNLLNDEVHFSARWFSLLGYEQAEARSSADTWLKRIHPDDRARVRGKLEAHIAGASELFEDEHRLLTADGSYLWMLVRGKSVRSETGVPERIAGSLTNISTRGIFDPLTGLPNRLMLQERLSQLFESDGRFGKPGGSLLFMDVNRFKFINDSLGHRVGDLLLLELAARLQSCVRGEDLVARLGGDEFVVLLSDVPERGVASVIERIEARVAERFDFEGEGLFTSLSIGVVADLTECDCPETVLERADAAMYEAKRSGVPHLYFDEQMLADAVATHRLETELHRALETDEFYLHYQPIVALDSGTVTGVEALLRWHHPERGFVSPAEFIPVAEDSGFIVSLGLWVLAEACYTLVAHPELGDTFTMSVNLSGKQLAQPGFGDAMRRILLETGVNPSQLKLEITETAIIENTDNVLEPLGELRRLGIQVVLDDFGTGYSSLTYLQHLPIDTLKIDRSFIQKMQEDERTLEIVGTIIDLAQTLSLDLVAEGIEERAELELLIERGCPHGQGYLFSKPVAMSDIVQLTLASTLETTPSVTAQPAANPERILS